MGAPGTSAPYCVNMFDAALASWVGVPPALCVFLENLRTGYGAGAQRDPHSCDHFVEPKILARHISTMESLARLAGSEQQRKFGNDKREPFPAIVASVTVRFAVMAIPKNRSSRRPMASPG